MATLAEGWGWPANARKCHYFLEGQTTSVCNRWMFFGDRQPSTAKSPDDCTPCRHWLDSRQKPAES